MPIDVAATLLRARVPLERAATLAEEGWRMTRTSNTLDVEQLRTTYSAAVEQGRLAVRELEALGPSTADARAGVTAMLDTIDPALHPRIGEVYMDGAHLPHNRLSMAADRLGLWADLSSLPPAEAKARMTAELDSILARPDAEIDEVAARRVGLMAGIPDDLVPTFPPRVFERELLEDFVGMGMTPRGNGQVRTEFESLRMQVERRAIEADPAATRDAFEQEVRAILARPEEELVDADIRRIGVIAGLSDRLRPAVVDAPQLGISVPIAELGARGWPIREASFVRRMLYSLRMPAVHEQMLASPTVREDATRELVRLLARPHGSLDTRDLERMATIARLPAGVRPELPERPQQWLELAGLEREPGRYLHVNEPLFEAREHLAHVLDHDLIRQELVALGDAADPHAVATLRRGIDTTRQLRELRALPIDEARRRTAAELEAVLALPDSEIDNAAMWRLAGLASLPEDLRPAMAAPSNEAYAFNRFARNGVLPADDSWAHAEIERLRIDRDARALDADPAITPAAVDAELRALLGVADADLTQDQLRRIGVLTSTGDRLRPAWTDVALPHKMTLRDYAANGWLPSPHGGTSGTLDALRIPIEHEAAIANGLTREQVDRELVELLVKPGEHLTEGDTRRLSWIARLPEAYRPSMPPEYPQAGRFEDIGLQGKLPTGSYRVADLLELGRIHVLQSMDAELLAGELRRRAAAGMDFELQVLDAISMHRDPAVLATLGLTPQTLETRALAALGAVHGVRRPMHIADALEVTRQRLVDPRATDDAALQLRDQTIELIDRNLDRMMGRRRDTYSNHPDYAEVGRVVANVTLLDAMRALSVAKAAPAAERLAW